ncbi:RsmD family RNA methyltransferase [soil metagenome]
MRIIAGQRRGHKIDGPPDRRTRPTSDMVRESIFNILRDLVADRPVIDLFAGTGALGLEALSRGASHATFIERRRENTALIRRNLAALRFEGLGTVVTGDAYRWARGFEPEGSGAVVMFLDPPYDEYKQHPDRLRDLLADLAARLPAGSVLLVESGGRLDNTILPDPNSWDLRRYGDTHLAFKTCGEEERMTLEP